VAAPKVSAGRARLERSQADGSVWSGAQPGQPGHCPDPRLRGTATVRLVLETRGGDSRITLAKAVLRPDGLAPAARANAPDLSGSQRKGRALAVPPAGTGTIGRSGGIRAGSTFRSGLGDDSWHAQRSPRASMRARSYHASPGACQSSVLWICLWII
jgi:hypothetical protein